MNQKLFNILHDIFGQSATQDEMRQIVDAVLTTLPPQSASEYQIRTAYKMGYSYRDEMVDLEKTGLSGTYNLDEDECVKSLLTTLSPQSEVDNGGWISVEDRLPMTKERFIVSYTDDDGDVAKCEAYYIHPYTEESPDEYDGEVDDKDDKFYLPKGWYRPKEYTEIGPLENVTHYIRLSSPGKPTQSGEAMEVLRELVGYWNNDQLECTASEWFDDVYKLIDRARHLVSSPTSENKEKK